MLTKTFQYFVKYDRQDTVSIGVAFSGDVGGSDVLHGSDTALNAAALAAKQSTWDEDTICAVHGLVRAPVVV